MSESEPSFHMSEEEFMNGLFEELAECEGTKRDHARLRVKCGLLATHLAVATCKNDGGGVMVCENIANVYLAHENMTCVHHSDPTHAQVRPI